MILIDVDSSSESNSNVFKLSSESNDSNSNYKTLERLSPPVTRRKSWLNRKTLKPHDNVIIDDDTQLLCWIFKLSLVCRKNVVFNF